MFTTAADSMTDTLHIAPIIVVRNLVKDYLVAQTSPQKKHFRFFGGGKVDHIRHRVLTDVTFSVKPGEVIGIVGRNGAGKSTLLKVLAGVLKPDSGEVTINGRVAPILELSLGFNPDVTGRENIIFSGLCLGMSHSEIDAKMESIIDFSELRNSIDHPLKTYSTGMHARLAFAVASSTDDEILIIDEALSVGDTLFQAKCFARIRSICASGRTILFVSHSTGHVQELCTRAILLHEGRVLAEGAPDYVTYEYEHLLQQERRNSTAPGAAIAATIGDVGEGTQDVSGYIQHIQCTDVSGSPISTLNHGETYQLHFHLVFSENMENVTVGFRVDTRTGLPLFGATTERLGAIICGRAGETRQVIFEFKNILADGEYILGGALTELVGDNFVVVHRWRRAAVLKSFGAKGFQGVFNPNCALVQA